MLIYVLDIHGKPLMPTTRARKVTDLGWTSFLATLDYVASKYGTIVHRIDRFYPSSRLCDCGYKNDTLTLKNREWTCPVCGASPIWGALVRPALPAKYCVRTQESHGFSRREYFNEENEALRRTIREIKENAERGCAPVQQQKTVERSEIYEARPGKPTILIVG